MARGKRFGLGALPERRHWLLHTWRWMLHTDSGNNVLAGIAIALALLLALWLCDDEPQPTQDEDEWVQSVREYMDEMRERIDKAADAIRGD